jgi:hypothetical protein
VSFLNHFSGAAHKIPSDRDESLFQRNTTSKDMEIKIENVRNDAALGNPTHRKMVLSGAPTKAMQTLFGSSLDESLEPTQPTLKASNKILSPEHV